MGCLNSYLKQFLVLAFESADAFTYGLLSRFVEDEEARITGQFEPADTRVKSAQFINCRTGLWLLAENSKAT